MSDTGERVYEVEVKLHLVRVVFPPSAGWDVNVDLDAMELGRGGKQPEGKALRGARAAQQLGDLGVHLRPDERYGRVDIVASHAQHGLHFLEVAGDSKRQREQALYSSLSQLLLVMQSWDGPIHYGVAVPRTAGWHTQLAKIPVAVRERLLVDLYMAGPNGVIHFPPREKINGSLRR